MKVCRMDCPYCGASIEADVENRKIVYCSYCGKQIQIENDSSNIAINQNINVNQRVINDAEILKEQNRHKENRWKFTIACVLLFLFVGGVSVLHFGKNKELIEDTNTNIKEENVGEKEKQEKPSTLQNKEKEESEIQSTNSKTDYSEESESLNEHDKQQIELIESGYSIGKSGHYTRIYYAIKVRNTNKEWLAAFPEVRITARSANGAILTTDDQYIPCIAEDETIFYAGEVLYEGQYPDTVEFSVVCSDHDFYSQGALGIGVVRQEQFEITNVTVNEGSYERTFTGEISNKSDVDADSAEVIVVLRKEGKLVGGTRSYVDHLKSGATVPFVVYDNADIEYDSYEVYGLFD